MATAPTGKLAYRYSRYLHWKKNGLWAVIFHELHPDPLYIRLDFWNQLRTNPQSITKELFEYFRRRGLLVLSDTEDEESLVHARSRLDRQLDRASILYLVLVQDCNFTCSYCPIPSIAKQVGKIAMTPSIVRRAVDLWAEHIKDDYTSDEEYFVIFYGGEPLLNKPAIKVGLKHIAHLQAQNQLPSTNLRLMVSTNGTMIDEELIQIFKQFGVMVAVGCDGPEEYHDRIRRDIEDQPTFLRVAEAIQLLVKSGIRTFASVSITPYNLGAIEHFSEFFTQFGVEKFGFNFLRGKLLFSLVPQEQLADYYDKATTGVIQNFVNFGERHFEAQVERKYNAYHGQRFFPTDCNGYGDQLVIQPNGQVGNCPFLKSDMGHVHSVGKQFRISQLPQVREWRKRLPLYNEACHTCDAKSICGGGCAWNAQEIKGDPLAVDDAMCLLTRKLFDRLIWSGCDRGALEESKDA